MKNIKYSLLWFLGIGLIWSCSDEIEEVQPEGNPSLEINSEFSDVHFGDALPFEVTVQDNVPLSTLSVKLYFGEEEVSNTVIRTKENGDYSGHISVPFQKNIPDGTATLEFVLNNITLKEVQKEVEVPITRAPYPYLVLVTEGASYPMLPTDEDNEYVALEAFPSTELAAYIKTPVVDEKGSEIVFGWEAGVVTEGSDSYIPFVSPVGGTYPVSFNVKTYEAGPFFEISINGNKMDMIDKDNYQAELTLDQNQELSVSGLSDIDQWWIDPDFLEVKEADQFTFLPISGKYRITADLSLKYFRIETMDGNDLANLKEDGSGAVWVIGERVGKPSVTEREVGWEPSKGLCMAPVGDKVYQLTVVGGETVRTDEINFKFFHQKDWGGEFGSSSLTTTSDLIFIGDGDNGRDDGNLGLLPDVTLTSGATYVFTVDLTDGVDNAELRVEEK